MLPIATVGGWDPIRPKRRLAEGLAGNHCIASQVPVPPISRPKPSSAVGRQNPNVWPVLRLAVRPRHPFGGPHCKHPNAIPAPFGFAVGKVGMLARCFLVLVPPAGCRLNTSIAAASVVLIVDTATAAANSDGATYIYYTETDTALWGATYSYGEARDPICQYSDLEGSVVINRGRFISSAPAYSETTTNISDFMQYVGNLKNAGVNGGNYVGIACGNLGVPHAASVTRSCSSGILSDYDLLTQFGMVPWRDASQPSGIQGQQSGNAYTVVKIKKSVLTLAPPRSIWTATETFTLTSV